MSATTNQTKLKAFVAGHLAIAAKKAPAEANDYLMRWSDWVGAQIERLGLNDTPEHLVGLTAFDLADARDELATAAVRASKREAA